MRIPSNAAKELSEEDMSVTELERDRKSFSLVQSKCWFISSLFA